MACTVIIVASFLVLGAFAQAVDSFCVQCFHDDYPNATLENLEREFAMDFKKRLMEKLGMKTEPKPGPAPPIEIINALAGNQLQRDQRKPANKMTNEISSITILPQNDNIKNIEYNCEFCVQSDPIKQGAYVVTAVKLWLYLNVATKDRRLTVYQKSWKSFGKSRRVLDTVIKSSVNGWKAFKIMPEQEWLKTPWKSLHLRINAIKDKQNTSVFGIVDGKRPYMQLLTKPAIKHEVQKRTVGAPTNDCPTDGRCCKHTMTLNLERFVDWLIFPKNYEALNCKGHCPYLFRIRTMWSTLSALGAKRTRCCVPTKLDPLSILYNENGVVVKRDVEDMVVVSCGCV